MAEANSDECTTCQKESCRLLHGLKTCEACKAQFCQDCLPNHSCSGRTIDSRPATYQHIQLVQKIMHHAISNLMCRARDHDQSKLEAPELLVFDEFTPKLAKHPYGSEGYKECLKQMKPALDHHYWQNDHHPEHWNEGVKAMSLLNLLEMLCDWMASTKRQNDGDIRKSIEMNQKRFGYSDELKQILLNTLHEFPLEFVSETREKPKA